MAEIRELVLTFLERLSHNALPKYRKRETLDAWMYYKMFWFWLSVCFLSWRIGVKREQKEAVFRSQEDFPTCGSSSPRCIFKRSASRILSTPALSGRNILVLSAEITDWNFKINATKTARIWTCGLCWLFLKPEKNSFVPHSFDST